MLDNDRFSAIQVKPSELKPPPLSETEQKRLRAILTGAAVSREGENNAFEKGDASAFFLGEGQERFQKALDLGIESDAPFHNIAVFGLSGPEGLTLIGKQIRARLAKGRHSRPFHASGDWCLVYNFDSPPDPAPIPLKQGKGLEFKKKMARLLARLQQQIPYLVHNGPVSIIRKNSQKELGAYQQEREKAFRQEVIARDFVVMNLDMQEGIFDVRPVSRRPVLMKNERDASSVAPPAEEGGGEQKTAALTADRRPMSDAEIQELSQGERDEIAKKVVELNVLLQMHLVQIFEEGQRRNSEYAVQMREMVGTLIGQTFDELHVGESGSALSKFLQGLKEYATESFQIFLSDSQKERHAHAHGSGSPAENGNGDADPFLPWKVNVLVDNTEITDPVPIIAGRIDSLTDLAGRIDGTWSRGAFYSDHTKVRPGFAAEANGGFLVVSAHDIVTVPGVWLLLKRYIKNQELTFETVATLNGWRDYSVPLSPLPIPLRLRVIVYGDRHLLSLLSRFDSEFSDLFRLRAEVLPFVERSETQVVNYGAWMKWFTDERRLCSPSEGAVSACLAYAERLTERHGRLSTDFAELESVIEEAALYAEKENAPAISEAHMQSALKERFWRASFGYELMQERVRDKELLLSVSGEETGQINGLFVAETGSGVRFGFPMRVTSSVNVGKPNVVNIHHAAKMSGSIYQKADLTVQGLLKRMFAQKFGLALEVFFNPEQTYDFVDGDSASLAEFLVLLSSIAEVPLKQGFAVTGSLNLHGKIQPIGGAPRKIEGFFDACKAIGELDGTQAVVIPLQNKSNLTLREDVIKAVEDGKFSIFAVGDLKEAVEIFTGMEADAVYQRAAARLKKFWDDALKTNALSQGREEPIA